MSAPRRGARRPDPGDFGLVRRGLRFHCLSPYPQIGQPSPDGVTGRADPAYCTTRRAEFHPARLPERRFSQSSRRTGCGARGASGRLSVPQGRSIFAVDRAGGSFPPMVVNSQRTGPTAREDVGRQAASDALLTVPGFGMTCRSGAANGSEPQPGRRRRTWALHNEQRAEGVTGQTEALRYALLGERDDDRLVTAAGARPFPDRRLCV